MTQLWQIDAPHFVAAVIEQAGTITETAPIVRYMMGASVEWAREYTATKGWRMYRVDEGADA